MGEHQNKAPPFGQSSHWWAIVYAFSKLYFFLHLSSDSTNQQVLNLFNLRKQDSICEVGNKGECPGNGEVCCEHVKIVTIDPTLTDCSENEDYHCVGLRVSFKMQKNNNANECKL